MTEQEAVYCLKAVSERYPQVCEECPLYGETGCDHCYDDANDVAIKALEEIQQYRALGTVEELRVARDKQIGNPLFGNESNPIVTGETVSGLCPQCLTKFVCITPAFYKANGYGYCKECGQKLNWEEV